MFMYKLLFFNMLIISSLISISSFNWMGMWMGLEMNLMAMIPLMKSKIKYSSEASIKYFITQALASTLVLFAIIMFLNKYMINLSNMNFMILNSALLTKMGAAPFHFWFPEISEGLNWMNNLLLLTWQKIAPMILMMYNSMMTKFLIMIIIFCMIISSLMGLNQISLRKILTFSSINNIGWMMPSIIFSQMIWTIYFIIYSFINMNLIMMFYYFKMFYFNQIIKINNFKNNIKLLMFLNFLNLGGLPPFIGFYSKWLIINMMMNHNFIMLLLMMILFTLIIIYFYSRLFFSSMCLNMKLNLSKMYYNNMFITSNFFLMIFSMIIYLM